MAEAGMEVGEGVRAFLHNLVFLPDGIKTVNMPVAADLSVNGVGIGPCSFEMVGFNNLELHYDPRLGIRWGAHGNTTFYSAVK